MFQKLIKGFLLFVGLFLIGFGLGMIIAENFEIKENLYWLVTVASLIFGSFFTAFGIVKGKKTEEEEEELEEEAEDFEE